MVSVIHWLCLILWLLFECSSCFHWTPIIVYFEMFWKLLILSGTKLKCNFLALRLPHWKDSHSSMALWIMHINKINIWQGNSVSWKWFGTWVTFQCSFCDLFFLSHFLPKFFFKGGNVLELFLYKFIFQQFIGTGHDHDLKVCLFQMILT